MVLSAPDRRLFYRLTWHLLFYIARIQQLTADDLRQGDNRDTSARG